VPEEELERMAEEAHEHDMAEPTEEDLELIRRPISTDKLVSTGCTLVDLAICSGRVRGGGVPGGMIMEIFGPSGTGKTALAAEIAASAQERGGEVKFQDPEARFDKEYAVTYGVDIREEFLDYSRPDTVMEMFEAIQNWKPKSFDVINCAASDSLAALSTELEMDKGDTMGMKRAKDFSQGLRKTCRVIANKNILLVCTNQIRMGDFGYVTPGGMGIPFYCNLRLSLKPGKPAKLTKRRKLKLGDSENPSEIERVFGIRTEVTVAKNSIDEPFRSVPMFIVFNYGIDDIRGNLQWLKEVTKDTVYDAVDRKYQRVEDAIRHVEEDRELEKQLVEKVRDIWEEIEREMKVIRRPKVRR
jgi:recombination protein RecA